MPSRFGIRLSPTQNVSLIRSQQVPAETAIDLTSLDNRQRIANALLAQGLRPLRMRQAGRFQVQPHWIEGLANLARIGAGAYITRGVEQGRRDLVEQAGRERQAVVDAFLQSRMPQPTSKTQWGQLTPSERATVDAAGVTPPLRWDLNMIDANHQVTMNELTKQQERTGLPFEQPEIQEFDLQQGQAVPVDPVERMPEQTVTDVAPTPTPPPYQQGPDLVPDMRASLPQEARDLLTEQPSMEQMMLANYEVLANPNAPPALQAIAAQQIEQMMTMGRIQSWQDLGNQTVGLDAQGNIVQVLPKAMRPGEQQALDLERQKVSSELANQIIGPDGQPQEPFIAGSERIRRAGRATTDINLGDQEKAFEKELGKVQAKAVIEGRDAAQDAVQMITTTHEGRRLIDSGIITGAGAEYIVSFGKALRQVGFDVGGDDLANTEAYMANMAQNVGKQIKQFGAGTGLSDADREYAEKMAAGRVSVTKESLLKIHDINERAARNVIRAHNQRVSGIETNIPLTIEEPGPYIAPAQPTQETPEEEIRRLEEELGIR